MLGWKNHYLQFSLDDAQDELLLKWVKRLNGKSASTTVLPFVLLSGERTMLRSSK